MHRAASECSLPPASSSRRVPCTTYPHNPMYHQISPDAPIECPHRSRPSQSWGMMPAARNDRAGPRIMMHDRRSGSSAEIRCAPRRGPGAQLLNAAPARAGGMLECAICLLARVGTVHPARAAGVVARIFPLVRPCATGGGWMTQSGSVSTSLGWTWLCSASLAWAPSRSYGESEASTRRRGREPPE